MAIVTPTAHARFYRGLPIAGGNPANKDVSLEFNRPVRVLTWTTSYNEIPVVPCEFRIEVGDETELETPAGFRVYVDVLHTGVLPTSGDQDQAMARFSSKYQGQPLVLGEKRSDHVRFTLSAAGAGRFGSVWVYAEALP